MADFYVLLGGIMKRALTLVLIVGIFTTGIFVSLPKPAYAYCVYNKAAFSINGEDTRKGGAANKYWEKSLSPGKSDCCPGDNSECQDATIHIDGGKGSCEQKVGAHEWLVVHSISTPDGDKPECKLNEPV